MIASADPARGTGRTGQITRHSKRWCKHPPREIADGQKWHKQPAASAGRGGKRGGYGAKDIDREDGKHRGGRALCPPDRSAARADGRRGSGDHRENHCCRTNNESANRKPEDGMNGESFRSIDCCSRDRGDGTGKRPDDERCDHLLMKGIRRLFGNNQAQQVDMQSNVQKPPDVSAHKCRSYPLGIEWGVVTSTQLKNVGRTEQGNSHQRRHARRAAPYGCRPQKRAPPTISKSRSRSYPKIGCRSLGPHGCTEAYRGDHGEHANRCQAPGKALLLACEPHHISGQIRARNTRRKSSPGARPPGALDTLGFTAQTESVKHQN